MTTISGTMQKALHDRAETIVRKGLLDCTGKDQNIYFLRELREQATIHLSAQLDGLK